MENIIKFESETFLTKNENYLATYIDKDFSIVIYNHLLEKVKTIQRKKLVECLFLNNQDKLIIYQGNKKFFEIYDILNSTTQEIKFVEKGEKNIEVHSIISNIDEVIICYHSLFENQIRVTVVAINLENNEIYRQQYSRDYLFLRLFRIENKVCCLLPFPIEKYMMNIFQWKKDTGEFELFRESNFEVGFSFKSMSNKNYLYYCMEKGTCTKLAIYDFNDKKNINDIDLAFAGIVDMGYFLDGDAEYLYFRVFDKKGVNTIFIDLKTKQVVKEIIGNYVVVNSFDDNEIIVFKNK